MLFYINQFELHIPEALLKKGFALYQNSEVQETDMQNTFLVSRYKISVNVNNNQLRSYNCQCKKDNYCSHLAALLFYLQENKLKLQSAIPLQKTRSIGSKSIHLEKEVQKIIFGSTLVDFPKKKTNQNQKKSDLLNYFDAFTQLHLKLIKTLDHRIPLDQVQINHLVKILNHSSQIVKLNKDKKLLFDWQLSVLMFFIFLNDFRFIGNESALFKKLSEIETELHKVFIKGMDPSLKQSWLSAGLISLKSNKYSKSPVFYFLIPRYIAQCKSHSQIEKIALLIKQRQFKKPYHEPINKMEIVKHQVHFKLHGLPQKLDLESSLTIEPEYAVALCDFYFYQNKPDKAFKIIDVVVDFTIKKQIALFKYFVTYAIGKCREYEFSEKEIIYLRLGFVYALQINDEELTRFKNLIPKSKIKGEINQLAVKIKAGKGPFTFDKLMRLYITSDNHPELIALLIHEKNKFKLLHQTILKAIHVFDPVLMKVYVKQLGVALQEANSFAHQKKHVELSKELLSLLPFEKQDQILNLIINETGYESQIGKFILSEFEKFEETIPGS